MISPLPNFSSQQRRVGAQHLLPTPCSISWSAPGFQKLRELSTPDATDATGSTTEGRLQLSSVGRGTGRSAEHSAAPAASRPRAGGSSSGRGSGCVKWLQERLGQARASAAGGTEAMAEPGPHPSSQPNTPRPVARSQWLSLFFKLSGLGDHRRLGQDFQPPPSLLHPLRAGPSNLQGGDPRPRAP